MIGRKIHKKGLNLLLGRGLKLSYLKIFFKDIKYPPATKGNILMYVGIGYMYLTHTEILLYHLLRLKGYNVDYYIYDASVALNEVTTQKVVAAGKHEFLKRSVKKAIKTLQAAKVDFSYINKEPEVDKLLAPVKGNYNDIISFTYHGVDFGNIVKGVLYRYYKSINVGDDPENVAYDFLETALTNYFQVQQLVSQKKYKYIIFSHGIYATWEPVVEYCKKINIDFISYDRAKVQSTININVNQPAPDWSFTKAWERNSARVLTDVEEHKVDEYLEARELQLGDVFAYNTKEKTKDLEHLRKQLGIKSRAKIITLFTNLIWDAANVARDVAFSSMLECILKTASYFKEYENVHVLVRTHPAEKVLGTEVQYKHLIEEEMEQFPVNFTIIPPDMDINSFSILELSDIGVVHTSTVGLEMAIEGKPVILISETHYRNKGFTYDVQNEVEYFDAIEALCTVPALLPNQVVLARKYFYMMMFEYQHKMPINYKNGVFDGYTYPSLNALAASKKEPIVKLVNKICKENKLDDFVMCEN